MSNFVQRKIADTILSDMEAFPTLTLTGPRQSGKTTLCKNLFPKFAYVNAEDAMTRHAINDSPKAFLQRFPQGLIVDEAQRVPDIFSAAQVLVDEDRSRRFVFTGSCNFALVRGISQSLAGRTAVHTLLPFSLEELGAKRISATKEKLIFQGGYPAVWQSAEISDNPSRIFRPYLNTYIERDLRELTSIKNLSAYLQFVRLCAGMVGNEFNASTLAGELAISSTTAREWLSILEASYIVFRLPPFFKNIKKRIVKTPKIYFYDTGLACFLLGIENAQQLETHPLRGALFENFVVAEFFKRKFSRGKPTFSLSFYRDKTQREVDLIEERAGKYYAYEIKASSGIHDDFFRTLEYFRKLIGTDVVSTKIIYDGDTELDIPENGIVNFRNL